MNMLYNCKVNELKKKIKPSHKNVYCMMLAKSLFVKVKNVICRKLNRKINEGNKFLLVWYLKILSGKKSKCVYEKLHQKINNMTPLQSWLGFSSFYKNVCKTDKYQYLWGLNIQWGFAIRMFLSKSNIYNVCQFYSSFCPIIALLVHVLIIEE